MLLIVQRSRTGVIALMQDEPADLPPAVIADVLRDRWGLTPDVVRYAPVGFGSCHWIAEDDDGRRWFVTANHLESTGHQALATTDEIYAAILAAADTAAELATTGLEFVVAGLPTTTGDQLVRLPSEWAVGVFPHIHGWSTADGEWIDARERQAIARILARLHTTPPPPSIQPWDLAIPHRQDLIGALDDLDETWRGGPYADLLRKLLVSHAPRVRDALVHYDRLVDAVRATGDGWVVTHGEPHSANVIRTPTGDMRLIDWDTVRLAPRERDLSDILVDDDGTAAALAEYQRIAGPVQPDPNALILRRTWWTLAEISEYVRRFRRPHAGSADDRTAWDDLCHELDHLERR